jgi:uncharacterized membrane protein YkvA (DUF1232 family)
MTTLLTIALAIVTAWLILIAFVWLVRPERTSLGDAVRLLPDTLRLVGRLARDRSVPRSTRALIWGVLAYLAMPIDLVPDFIPVIGYADDVILVAFVLRRVIRRAGAPKLAEHWPGSDDGLATLSAVLRLRDGDG